MAITYHDLYLKTRMALSSAGIEAAQLEAREILCAAAEKTAEELYRDISLYTTDAIAEKTEALQARRLAGELNADMKVLPVDPLPIFWGSGPSAVCRFSSPRPR